MSKHNPHTQSGDGTKSIPARPVRDLMWLLVLIILWSACVLAQGQEVAPPPASIGPAAPTTAARTFSQEELDQLLAPIALYPDALLAQVLMASTYPLEVVEADRWAKAHSYLAGDQLQAALQEQSWDPSVKGLVTVPQVLNMMDEKLDWTEKLGDAFLAQQQDVMETVQRLRAKAQAAGNLSSTPQQAVVAEGATIAIQPVNPEVIYVPVYNPFVIYGPWWWPAPPYYWYPPGYAAPGPFIYFSVGVVVGAAIWGTCDWGHRTVIVNVHNYNTFNRTRITNPHWAHDVDHRRGVPYRDDAIRREYRRELPGAEARRDFRGYQAPPPRYSELPRLSGGQIHEEPARPGGARPAPGAGDRVPPVPPAPRQPPSVGQRIPVAPPIAHQPAGVEQRLPPGPPVARQAPGAAQHVPPAFETFPRGDAARAYSDRGAASRSTHTYAPAAGAQVARPPGGGAQSSRPQGARPPSR